MNAAAAAAFAAGAFQVFLSQEAALAAGESWLSAVAVFTLAPAALGLGGLLGASPGGARRAPSAAAWGLLLLLAASLRLDPARPAALPAALALAGTAAALLGLGACFGGAARAALAAGASPARLCAAAAGAAAAGLLAGAWAGVSVGAHAGLLALAAGAALLPGAAPRRRAALGAALAALLLLAGRRADAALESLRPALPVPNVSNPYFPRHWRAAGFQRLWGGWSPYARVDLFKSADGQWLAGAYNYRALWNWGSHPIDVRYPGFDYLRPTDRVALIGASAGYELRFLPETLPRERVTLVEIDPAVVSFFLAHPEENGRAYLDADRHAGDGRLFLERRPGAFDAVLVGSLDSGSRSFWRSARPGHSLYTREGFAAALAATAPEGLLVYLPRDPRAAGQVCALAEEAGLDAAAFWRPVPATRAPWGESLDNAEFTLLFSRRAGAAAAAAAAVSAGVRAAPERWLSPVSPAALSAAWRGFPAPTDDRPYAAAGDPAWAPLLAAAWPLALAGAAALAAAGSAAAPGGGYFFLLGFAWMGLQLTAFGRWRVGVAEPAAALLGLNAALLLLHAAGNAFCGRLLAPLPRAGRAAALAAAAACTAWALARPEPPAGLLAAALWLAPGAFASGWFFPRGLSALGGGALRAALLWDGLGAAWGYAAFLLGALALGHRAAGAAALAAYAAAALLLPRRGALDTRPPVG